MQAANIQTNAEKTRSWTKKRRILSHIIGPDTRVLGRIENELAVADSRVADKLVKLIGIDGVVFFINRAADNLFFVLVNKKTNFVIVLSFFGCQINDL